MPDRCEWNPVLHQAAYDPPSPDDCPNQAELIVGANGAWRLCRRCWEQDRAEHFWRYRVIREIRTKPSEISQPTENLTGPALPNGNDLPNRIL